MSTSSMNFCMNTDITGYYQTWDTSADLMREAQFVDITSLQTTLTAPYDATNRVLHVANSNFNGGREYWPNMWLDGLAVRIPTTTGTVVAAAHKLAGQPILRLDFPDDAAANAFAAAAIANNWGPGTIVDGGSPFNWQSFSGNPADWPMEEYVTADGRHTGFPRGLRGGQVMKSIVFSAPHRLLIGGAWHALANGTGRCDFALSYRDRAQESVTVNFMAGVPDRTLDIDGDECWQIQVALTESSFSDPLEGLRIVPPIYWPVDGSEFSGRFLPDIYNDHADDVNFYLTHPNFVAAHQGVRYIRFVQAIGVLLTYSDGHSGVRDVSERAMPETAFGRPTGGTPWEHLFAQAKQSGAGPYFNFPNESSEATVAACRDIWKRMSGPGDSIIVTRDCEPWNFDFLGFRSNSLMGAAMFSPKSAKSMTYASGVVTAVMRAAHGMIVGDTVVVTNTEAAYRGEHTVTSVADQFTFTFALSVVPTHSPAQPYLVGAPIAFKAATSSTKFNVTSLRWVWGGNNTFDFPFPHSSLEITTDGPHGLAGGGGCIIAISNCAQPELNGIYAAATRVDGDKMYVELRSQAYHTPYLPASVDFASYPAVSGKTMKMTVLATDLPIGDAMPIFVAQRKYHGYATARVHKIWQDGFPGELDRLKLMIEGWIDPQYDRDIMETYLEETGGVLLPVSETLISLATYCDADYDQVATFAPGARQLNSITISGGVATATCVDQYGQGHFLTGTQVVTLYNADDVRLCCKVTVTVTSPTTFTFPAPSGVPDGVVSPFYGRLPAFVPGTPAIAEVTGVARTGTTVTFTSAHSFTVGQRIGLGQVFSPKQEGVDFVVSATTPTSFTVTHPSFTFDPAPPAYQFRIWAVATSVLDQFAALTIERAESDSYAVWLNTPVVIGEEYGLSPSTYESGYQSTATIAARFLEGIGFAITLSQRMPSFKAATRRVIDRHRELNFVYYTWYNRHSGWGNGTAFGLEEYDGQGGPKIEAWNEALATYGTPAPALPSPATGFSIVAPTKPLRLGEATPYFAVRPNGVVAQDTTVTLSEDVGSPIDPRVLHFKAGSTSAQPFHYQPTQAGPHLLTAISSPNLGGLATAMPTTLDEDGNPGTATLLCAEDANRPDGELGAPWQYYPGTARIKDNTIELDGGDTVPNYSGRCYLPTVLKDSQVRVIIKADTTSPIGNLVSGVFFRSDELGRLNFTRWDVRLNFQYNFISISVKDIVGYQAIQNNTLDRSHDYMLTVKCHGTEPTLFDIRLVDLTLGTVTTDIANIKPNAVNDYGVPLEAVPSAGYSGLSMGLYGSLRFDDLRVSELSDTPAKATGFGLAGPTTGTVGVATTAFTVSPQGGAVEVDTVVTPSDGGEGGTFVPPSLTFSAGSTAGQSFTYTPATQGSKVLTAASSPSLGTPPTATVVIARAANPATGYSLSTSSNAGIVGTSTTVTATLTGGTDLATDLVITLASSGGTFQGPIAITRGATSGQTTFTPTSSGTLSISASHSGGGSITDPSPISFVVANQATQARATGFSVVVPSAVVVGQPSTIVVVLQGGLGLTSDLVVTLADSGATIGGPVTITAGSSYGTTSYTPTTAGQHFVTSSYTGGNAGMNIPGPVNTFASVASGGGLTADQVQAACAAAIRATPATVGTVTDKSGYGLTTAERSAIASGVDAALTASHGSGQWTTVDPLATLVAGRYAAGTAGSLIAAIPSIDAIATTLAASSISIKAGGITSSSFASGVTVPLPTTPPSGYGGSSLTTAQVQTACAAAITATPAKITDKTGYVLASSGLDSLAVETGVNGRQAMSLILAASAGIISGAGTGTISIKGANTNTTRITAVTDNAGNRSSIQLNMPS